MDSTLAMKAGDDWVITTPEALQATAAGGAVAPADLLTVRCGLLKDGSFIDAL